MLSIKLLDLLVFTGNKHVLFDDWKMRIQDKLVYNDDYYPTESFKIVYIITRLGGDVSGHVSIRRRFTPYDSVNDLLDYLTDLYEVSLNIVRLMHRRTYYIIAQGDQLFLNFYREFRKCVECTSYNEKGLIENLIQKSELKTTNSYRLIRA